MQTTTNSKTKTKTPANATDDENTKTVYENKYMYHRLLGQLRNNFSFPIPLNSVLFCPSSPGTVRATFFVRACLCLHHTSLSLSHDHHHVQNEYMYVFYTYIFSKFPVPLEYVPRQLDQRCVDGTYYR